MVQQSLGGDLIAAVAVIGAETRQLGKEHQTGLECGADCALKLPASTTCAD